MRTAQAQWSMDLMNTIAYFMQSSLFLLHLHVRKRINLCLTVDMTR